MAAKNNEAICLNDKDNVAVCPFGASPGDTIRSGRIVCKEPIPAGHKIAVCTIEAGEPVLKYGQIIGYAVKRIETGEHVHVQNVAMREFERDYAIGSARVATDYFPEETRPTFDGIVRRNGRVATRNYIGVLSTVNCSASVARFIAASVSEEIRAGFPNIDGVVALGHGSGCAITPGGEGMTLLQRTMAGYARNPNFGGILLVGLGCEVNQIDTLMSQMHLEHSPLLKSIGIQASGGTRKTVEKGAEAIRQMLPLVNNIKREPVGANHLVLGMECGGSDAYSGISANPAMGAAADLLVRHGGTAILSETPEVYGAEHLLTCRAASREVAEKLIQRIQWWESYTTRLGGEINNNPSPGNKAGGLTTILEKSLGAVAKAGTTNLMDVFQYAEPVTTRGLVFMDTPGYDVTSVNGMIAGGANLICFTTGCGSVSGFKPVPTLKLASNTEMYNRLSDDMDFNCGPIVTGEESVKDMGEKLFRLILETASGKNTRSESLNFGDSEFAPWPIGAVL